jgi:hypothetical protein
MLKRLYHIPDIPNIADEGRLLEMGGRHLWL